MARLGEGDRRWIVQERPDGQNVHNWHWSEKNCLEWSKNRLGELLTGLIIADGEGGCWCRTTTVESVEGEAYVNIRKGKMIPGYELKVRVKWAGECRDGDGKVVASAEGKLELPYIADENADEDPEVRVSVNGEGPAHGRLRDVVVAKARSLVQERVAVYVKEMKEGGPAREEVSKRVVKGGGLENAAPPSSDTAATKNWSSTRIHTTDVATVSPSPPPSTAIKEGMRTITMSQSFFCRSKDVYDIMMDEKRWKGFTLSNAKISREVGGGFSIFDGAVTGVNMKLEPNKLILQKWRFSNWQDGHYSTVCLTFEEPETGIAVVKLTQTDVPEEDRFGNHTVVENTERGWRDHIFNKIRAVFGYGC